jgi:hypothetical protein
MPRVVFYVGAHQDDWQLFMSPQAGRDLEAADTRVVFVYTTAGDGGVEPAWRQGRTAGALSSTQFGTRRRIEPLAPERVEINAHPVACYEIGHTRSYFLDLPDGNGDGAGFTATGHQSLQRLYEGACPEIAALSDSPAFPTRYVSWQDVVATLRALLDREAGGGADGGCVVHFLDPDTAVHSDHRFTGIAVQEAIAGDARFRPARYEDYSIVDKAPNVEGVDLAMKTGLYLFYAQTAFEHSGRTHQFDELHLSFLPRQYRTDGGEGT